MPSIRGMIEEQRELASLREDGESFRLVKAELARKGTSGDVGSQDLNSLLGSASYDLDWGKSFPWQHFTNERVRKAVDRGYTVFVDYTADWCPSCKYNKHTAIDVAETRRVMKELGVVPFEADYTNRDPRIKADLDKYNRPGVPMYLVYRPHKPDEPEVLPEVLTPSVVIDGLRRAGPTKLAESPSTSNLTLAQPSGTEARASSR